MAEDDLLVPAQPGPDLNIPDGTSTVEVSCIDTTSRFRLTMTTFLQPDYVGNPDLKGPSFSFLIKHNDHKILFDLGIRSDFQKLPVYEKIVEKKWDVHVDKDAATILKEHDLNVDGGVIRSIILSHHHWDHTGNISLFPHSTEVVVGPGFVKAHLPGRPDRPDSTLLQSDFEGRAVREINFAAASSKQIKIGRFRAHDFFGDGSFYLLDTPGHSIGHICGLARTSVSPATFVFMGGDACHHGAEFKPNVHTPLPKNFHPSPLKKYRGTCPGEALQHIHPYSKANEPFYYVTESFPDDKKVADWTVEGLEEFDADPHVLMVVAHDNSLIDPMQLPVFPQTLNTWHEQGLAKKVRWIFLRDLDEAVVAKEEGKEPFKWADQ